MAKIDEVAELLVEEVNELKKTTKELKQMLSSFSVPTTEIDLSHVNEKIGQLHDIQKQLLKKQYLMVENVIAATKAKPQKSSNIIKGGLISLGIVFMAVFGYALFEIKQLPETEKRKFNQGKQYVIAHFSAFFEANPKAKKRYDLWIENNNN